MALLLVPFVDSWDVMLENCKAITGGENPN